MISDAEIKAEGFRILAEHLGDVEAERFIALIQRDQFDYTRWRQENLEAGAIEDISRKAMAFRRTQDSEA